MSFVTPKIDWTTNPKNPLAEDFNRIEGNIDFLKADIETKKGLIVQAINEMGQSANLNDLFATLYNKIRAISTDTTAKPSTIFTGETAYINGTKQTGTAAPRLPNLFRDGSFERNGITGWTVTGGSLFANTGAKYGTYSLGTTGATNSTELCASYPLPYIQGHKYYVSAWAYSTTAGKTFEIYFPLAPPYPNSGNMTCVAANTWYFNSYICSETTITSGTYSLRLDNNNANAATTMLFDGILVIDLTDCFGAGKEPSKAVMDAIVTANGGWWDSDLQLLTADTNSTANTILAGYSAVANGVKLNGAIPSLTPVATNPDQFTAIGLNAGQYSADGLMYAYLQVPPYSYTSSCAWIRSYQPDLQEANIKSGKSIFGKAGTAIHKKYATGAISGVWQGDDTYSFIVNNLTFRPKTVILVMCDTLANTDTWTNITQIVVTSEDTAAPGKTINRHMSVGGSYIVAGANIITANGFYLNQGFNAYARWYAIGQEG